MFAVGCFPLEEEGAWKFDVGGAVGGLEFEETLADLYFFLEGGHLSDIKI
jgi:hypothetical protein